MQTLQAGTIKPICPVYSDVRQKQLQVIISTVWTSTPPCPPPLCKPDFIYNVCRDFTDQLNPCQAYGAVSTLECTRQFSMESLLKGSDFTADKYKVWKESLLIFFWGHGRGGTTTAQLPVFVKHYEKICVWVKQFNLLQMTFDQLPTIPNLNDSFDFHANNKVGSSNHNIRRPWNLPCTINKVHIHKALVERESLVSHRPDRILHLLYQ